MSRNVKLVVYVPIDHADKVRESLVKAGAGHVGNYDCCSFSSRGVGRFRPLEGSNPVIGELGKLEEVEEERIEVLCPRDRVKEAINAMTKVHPYEAVAYDIYPVENL
ncbi:hypothetical protein KJ705_01620 [Patescibacteria group bacterium]|nr:hypothetical protein [Patescibacteria group bacterium]MBU2235594.1 hypothetical protein [Patescibacteria group bacterium]